VSERTDSVDAATDDFFDRARRRLTLEVPAALTNPAAEGARGDLDLNPEVWRRAGVKATKPAAVLVPVIDRAPDIAHSGARQPRRPGRISRR